MKAAIVHEIGQTPVYGDFAQPMPSSDENRITVTAAAINHVVKSRASGTHYSSSGQLYRFTLKLIQMAGRGSRGGS